jgi:hypothetical protein
VLKPVRGLKRLGKGGRYLLQHHQVCTNRIQPVQDLLRLAVIQVHVESDHGQVGGTVGLKR